MKSAFRKTVSLFLIMSLLFGTLQSALAASLTLPAQLRVIEASAFEGDQSIDEVTLPDGLEEIYDRAFADSSLSRINLPDSLTWISQDAFEGTQNVSFRVNTGSYAHRWLRDNRYILSFADDMVYDFSAEMAIAENDEALGLYTDSFAAYFELADREWWQGKLSGTPLWQVEQLSGPEMPAWLDQPDLYSALLNVGMPASPGEAEFTVRCVWDGQEVSGRVTVSYVYPNSLPQGADIPDLVTLTPGTENVIPLSFVPSSFAFGRLDRAGLENYSGPADIWFEGHELHIIPWSEGTFTGTVTLYAGNLYIAKPVVFRVGEQTEGLNPYVEASWLDCFTVTWNEGEENSVYTVFAYLDEQCTQLYRSLETQDSYLYFNTDVGTQYWFVVEARDPSGNTLRSHAVTAQPIEPLPAPENLTLELLSDGAVIPSWSPVPGASGYRLYWSTESGVWSPETEWYSIMGDPADVEDWSLWIDEGQTLFLWVCADNGDGPNLRAFARVSRGRDTGIDQFTDLLNDEDLPETLYLTGYDFTPIPTDGVTDPDELSQIEAFNENLPEFEASVTAYNAQVDELYALLDTIFDELGLTSLEVTDTSLSISSDLMDFGFSTEAAELLNGGLEGAAFEMIGEDTLQAAIEKNGVTRYVLFTENGVSVSFTPAIQNKAALISRGEDESSGSQKKIDWLGFSQQLNKNISGISAYAAIINECAPECVEKLSQIKGWGKITAWAPKLDPFANALGVGVAYNAGRADSEKIARLGAIAGHGHPTAVERLHQDSLNDAVELNALIAQARLIALSDLGLNAAGASAGIILLSKLLAGFKWAGWAASLTPAANLLQTAKAKAAVYLMNLSGLSLGVWLDALMEDIDRLDRRLHYDAFGALTEEGSGNRMNGVEIWYNDIDYHVPNSELGLYEVELPTATASLVFKKDGYHDQPETFPVIPKEPTRHDVVMRKKAFGLVTGTVKDQFGDPVGYVSITSGLFSATSREDGTFSISLPAESRTITFTKTGYIEAPLTVSVSEGENPPLTPVLNWEYGVRGVVTDESGPLAGAWVSFRKYAVSSEGSWSTHTDENGEFRHLLPPGTYTLTVSKNGCILADLIHSERKESVTVPEQGIQEFNTEIISAGDRYIVQVSTAIPEFGDQIRYHTRAAFSWEGYTAAVDFSDAPQRGPIVFWCVSENRYVSVTGYVEGTVNGELRTYPVNWTVDLESLKSGHTSIEMSLGSEYH